MGTKPKKLILIDGNAIIHRSFHALPPLTTKSGELVNAVYGFASTLLSVISKFQPDYVIATFDLKAPTFRHKEFAEYKGTRAKAPDELYAQIERVKELVRAFSIPIYEKEGFEADDVIGTIVTQAERSSEEIESIIVTGDLDTLQLVSEKTKVYALRRGITDTVLYGEAEVFERFSLRPNQMIDYKGLRGDASDNIPGVKGIGEKTATELLKSYETLENVYAHIAEIKGAVKDKLEKDRSQAIKSKWLATIVLDAPVELKLADAVTREFDRETIVKLFQELNFFSLIKRLPMTDPNLPARNAIVAGGRIQSESTNDANGDNTNTLINASDSNNMMAVHSVKSLQGKDAEGVFHGVHPVKSLQGKDAEGVFHGVKDFKFELITEDKLDEFIKTLKSSTEISLTLEVVGGAKYFSAEIRGIAIAYKTGRAGYIAFDEAESIKEKIKSVLEDEKIKKIGYNLKNDLEILKMSGINLCGIDFDIMLSAYVLNPGGKAEFSEIVLAELGEEFELDQKKGQLGLEIESPIEVADRFCRVADYIFKLKSIHEKKLAEVSAKQNGKHNLLEVFRQVEMPLVEILSEMEMHGVKLNPTIFEGISEKIEKRIASLEKSIHALAGENFNINSPKQIAEILFNKLQISTADIKKGKTGFSTASAELTKLRGEHKIIAKIEEYREIFKLKTTYLDTLPTMLDKESRIHSTFNQAVTATGRLSSSDPNLQNIPIRTDVGQLLRTAFEAREGWRLVSADYSQIDLRVVAHVSGDKNMIEAFRKGEDIHRATAAIINKITTSQVTEKMRSKAKALNFGIIYGMSVFGFSASADISREEAKTFINEYMEKFSGVARYMRETKIFAKENQFVETEIGRRRNLPEINSPNFQVQNSAERMAINMPIQGLSADIVKLAMIATEKIVKSYAGQVRTILQVHDELIFEVKEKHEKEFMGKIKLAMENVYKLKVPLVVNVKAGDNWGEI